MTHTHDRLVRELANGVRAALVFVDYARSPEKRFPTALEEAYAATKYVAAHAAEPRVDAARLAGAGDSAGGNLAAAVTRLAKERRGPRIAFQVLFYPVTDAALATESYAAFANGPCHLVPLAEASGDAGGLYHASHSLLLAHEDKTYPGAMIASLSIPWGEVKDDEHLEGYHLVWTRDMVSSTTVLLASGNTETPLRALIYLACSQQPDGGFHQNFWIDAVLARDPARRGRLPDPARLEASRGERPGRFRPLSHGAAGRRLPDQAGAGRPAGALGRERRLLTVDARVQLATLTCAPSFAHARGDEATAAFLQQHADFLEGHVEA